MGDSWPENMDATDDAFSDWMGLTQLFILPPRYFPGSHKKWAVIYALQDKLGRDKHKVLHSLLRLVHHTYQSHSSVPGEENIYIYI